MWSLIRTWVPGDQWKAFKGKNGIQNSGISNMNDTFGSCYGKMCPVELHRYKLQLLLKHAIKRRFRDIDNVLMIIQNF